LSIFVRASGERSKLEIVLTHLRGIIAPFLVQHLHNRI